MLGETPEESMNFGNIEMQFVDVGWKQTTIDARRPTTLKGFYNSRSFCKSP